MAEAEPRRYPFRWPAYRWRSFVSHRPGWTRLRPRRATHLRRLDRRAKSRGGTPRRTHWHAVDAATAVFAFSRPCRAARAARRAALGRRAADARDRAHPDGQPDDAAARRAWRRTRAVDRRAARRSLARVQASGPVDIARRAKPGARRLH